MRLKQTTACLPYCSSPLFLLPPSCPLLPAPTPTPTAVIVSFIDVNTTTGRPSHVSRISSKGFGARRTSPPSTFDSFSSPSSPPTPRAHRRLGTSGHSSDVGDGVHRGEKNDPLSESSQMRCFFLATQPLHSFSFLTPPFQPISQICTGSPHLVL